MSHLPQEVPSPESAWIVSGGHDPCGQPCPCHSSVTGANLFSSSLFSMGVALPLEYECQESGGVTKWPGITLDPPSAVAEQLPLARQDGTGLRPQLSL